MPDARERLPESWESALHHLLGDMAALQGEHQGAEEIIKRTRRVLTQLPMSAITQAASDQLIRALGSVVHSRFIAELPGVDLVRLEPSGDLTWPVAAFCEVCNTHLGRVAILNQAIVLWREHLKEQATKHG